MDPSRQPGRCLWTPQDSLVGVYGPLKTAWSVSMDPSRQPGRCLWTPQDSLVGVYGPLKTAWEKIRISFAGQNLGAALAKETFPGLLNKLWMSGCLAAENIKAGFARCGIMPFNPQAVPRTQYESSEIFDKLAPEQSAPSASRAPSTPATHHKLSTQQLKMARPYITGLCQIWKLFSK